LSTKAAKAKKTDAPVEHGSLQVALKRLEQSYGKGTLMKLGAHGNVVRDTKVVSTGSFAVDDAIGIGGLPTGRIIEIYGPEASGKTSLALSVIAQAQKLGKGAVAFVDVEHALDPDYARCMGVDIDDLYVAQPDSGEQALEIVDALVRSGAMSVVVLDSIAALVPQAEIDSEMGTPQMGLQARLVGQALRKITPGLAKSETVLIFINQLRQKLGVMYGSNEVTPGGNAMKYFASVRLDVRRVEFIKEGDQPVGTTHRVKVVKNKLAPPFATGTFSMLFGKGIDRGGELLDLAVARGVVVKKGAFFALPEGPDGPAVQLGQGKAKAGKALEGDATLRVRVQAAVTAKRAQPTAAVAAAVADDDDDEEAEGEAGAATTAAADKPAEPAASTNPAAVQAKDAAPLAVPEGNLLDAALQRSVVAKKRGQYFYVDPVNPEATALLGPTKAKAEDAINESEDVRNKIVAALAKPRA